MKCRAMIRGPKKQIKAAAEQAEEYPDTIKAIFVGNENVYKDGKYKKLI